MERVGFGIFGRPVKHEYVSNGLFRSLQLESETYLNLPNSAKLGKNDRIIKVSRQIIKPDNIEIIKIYIFDYAVSFQERMGGYVGSAHVFTGRPTKYLLYNAIKETHLKAINLLDENRNFQSLKIEIDINQLISPNSSELTYGNPKI